MENKELNESLKRYKELLGYDLEKGKRSLTERNHKPYLMEADPEGGNTDDNADFDFGDEGDSKDKEGDKGGFDFGDAGGEDTGGDDNAGFDFGDDQGTDTGDNGDFDFGGEGDTEEEVDEFGTADEFSAADDLETEDGDTEEIDVTDIVKRADDAKGSAEKAVVAAEEGKNMIKDLMAKFQNLEASLSKIDNVSSEISSIKQDLQMQKPKEKLELRSLDSYPFNVKLTDYWNDVAAKGNYEITDGNEPDGVSADGQVKVWDITPEDTKTYNATDIQKSFIPESKSKKKVLTENITEKYSELFNKLTSNGITTEDIKNNEIFYVALRALNQQDSRGMDVKNKLEKELKTHYPEIFTESKSKRKVLTEEQLLTENILTDILKKFSNNGKLKQEIKDKLNVDENSSKEEIKKSLLTFKPEYNPRTKQGLINIAKTLGGSLGKLIIGCIVIYAVWEKIPEPFNWMVMAIYMVINDELRKKPNKLK